MSEHLKVLTFEGILGIERAEEMKAQLLAVMVPDNSLIINLSRVEWIDLSILQILVSAKKTALENQISLQFSKQISESVLTAFRSCGISPNNGGTDLDRIIEDYLEGKR